MIEGGLGGWINSFKITGSHGCAASRLRISPGARTPRARGRHSGSRSVRAWSSCRSFSGWWRRRPFDGPSQMHFEYPLGGANNGARSSRIPREEVCAAMKRDLERVRGMLAQGRSMRRRAFLAMPAILAAAPSTDARIDEVTIGFRGLPLSCAVQVRRQRSGSRHDAQRALPVEYARDKSAEGGASMSMGNVWSFLLQACITT